MPQVELPTVKWPSFKSLEKALPARPQTQPHEVIETVDLKKLNPARKVVKAADVIPRLKPRFQSKAVNAKTKTVGLRGPFKFSVETPRRFGSFQDVRRETKAKWSATKLWFKTKTQALSDIRTLDNVANATDRLQDRVTPAGRTIKARFKDRLPGKGIVQLGERTMSVYGLILILAFGLVLLLMSLASPASRLGGRH